MNMFGERWRAFVARGVPPNSLRAYAFVFICIGIATVTHIVFRWIGGEILPFVTFFPAVLFSALFAGVGAGAAAIVLSILIAWTYLIPAQFGFSIPSPTRLLNYGLFAAASGLTVWLSHEYRKAIAHWQEQDTQRELLVRELAHRGRNTFAVVSSIVQQTLDDEADKAEKIVGRIHAVSATNDTITQSVFHTASLRSILEREFAPFDLARIALAGEPIELPADLARNMALVLHELVINAVKHGALSSPDGRVDVGWRRNSNRVALTWTEKAGPRVTPPSSQGFGTRLITATLKQFDGTIEADFAPTGLVATLEFSLE